MIGSWLCNKEVMSAIYFAWIDTPKALHIPDPASVTKISTLTQRSVQGTLISGGSVEQVEYILDPCTTHPDFFMRIRAYLMTICWLVIDTPTWFCFETALTTVDLIVEAIHCRPDGKRPSIQCLTACFLTMMSEYAQVLQNEGASFEACLKE